MKLVNLIPLKEVEGPSQKEVKAFNPIAKEYLESLAKYQTLADRQKDLTKPYFSAKTEEDRKKAVPIPLEVLAKMAQLRKVNV